LTTLPLIGIGLALGIRHATDSDHVVAVTAIAARHRRIGPAALVGALWGLGHTLTICVVGGAIILLNLTVPPRVGLSLEFAVGIALTVVGVLNIAGKGGFVAAADPAGKAQGIRAFFVGLVHGLAGSAAVALMVLATVQNPWAACAYLLVFGFGTILGMMLITIAFASPAAAMAQRFNWSGSWLRIATGLLSLGFGVYVMIQIGFVDGLFRAVPHWDPH
jgi:high-affinity nickel-transport protein